MNIADYIQISMNDDILKNQANKTWEMLQELILLLTFGDNDMVIIKNDPQFKPMSF
ncbi:hypothetical protein MHK_000254 [Candidatus Magnetomorum sp. HK-1]|nr:hypothetical protein MHK_009213 [Candidatus Magnetomorum sp. HK-1]KPA19527.1 hypothetical protein MHK_000254 [Candidatus Magnetomorum sp. HK-1]